MQIVKTDSVRPQNKVGLPIGVSDLIFLTIIHLSQKGKGPNRNQITCREEQLQDLKKNQQQAL